MAVPEVSIITDRDLGAPWLEERDGYLVGERRYMVLTDNEGAALDRTPKRGSAWNSDKKTLVLVAKRTDYWCGKDTAGVAPTSGGSTIVTGTFEEPRPGGRIVPDARTKYTDLTFGTETQTIFFEHRDETFSGPVLPLANGEGYGRKVGSVTARVVTFAPIGATLNYARLFRLTRTKPINDDSLTLPPLLGTTGVLNFAAGQVQYEGLLPPRVVTGAGGVRYLEIIHELCLAPDFDFRWEREDAEGNGIGRVQSKVYGPDSLSGLW